MPPWAGQILLVVPDSAVDRKVAEDLLVSWGYPAGSWERYVGYVKRSAGSGTPPVDPPKDNPPPKDDPPPPGGNPPPKPWWETLKPGMRLRVTNRAGADLWYDPRPTATRHWMRKTFDDTSMTAFDVGGGKCNSGEYIMVWKFHPDAQWNLWVHRNDVTPELRG